MSTSINRATDLCNVTLEQCKTTHMLTDLTV